MTRKELEILLGLLHNEIATYTHGAKNLWEIYYKIENQIQDMEDAS